MADENSQEILEGRPFAIISYLWILCVIPLFLKRGNRFVSFHAKQGVVLFLAEMAVSLIGILPMIGWALFFAGTLIFGALSLVGIVQAVRGNYWQMPLLGKLAQKIEV